MFFQISFYTLSANMKFPLGIQNFSMEERCIEIGKLKAMNEEFCI